MIEALTAWILSLMIALAPATPWRATYPTTARAIATEASAGPLFEGRLGVLKTSSLMTALAFYESTFMPDADGDCQDEAGKVFASVGGRCPEGTKPSSFCLFQIGKTNLAWLGVTRAEIQSDVTVCTHAAGRMLHVSMRNCHAKPADERLAWYASGGPICGARGTTESKHRMAKAAWLYRAFPPDAALLGYY